MNPNPPDEIGSLIEKIKTGNRHEREEGAHRLFELFGPKVASFFAGKGVPSEECRDLTQDVFDRVFNNIEALEGTAAFRAWLYKIAQHRFSNWLRGRKTVKRDAKEQSLSTPEEGGEGRPFEIQDTAYPHPLETMIRKEQRKALRRALDSLPEKMRECCMLRFAQALKYKEIADKMGLSIDTVKAHIFQGKRRLSEILQQNEEPGRPRRERSGP